MTLLMAVTGGIGSGKSTLCAAFARLGAEVVDADASARRAVQSGTTAHAALRLKFPECFDGEQLNRKALASVIFNDPELRAFVESVVHPWVRVDMAQRATQSHSDVVVCDIPLIAETRSRMQAQHEFDYVITVWSPMAIRKVRLAARGMPTDDVDARISAQATDEQRAMISDLVVPNVSTVPDLAGHAKRIMHSATWLRERRS